MDMRAGFCLLLALSGAASNGCGSSASSSDPSVTSSPTALSCPIGERISTDGPDYAEAPEGFATRKDAVRAWLSSLERSADTSVPTEDGESAWIVDPEGTVVAMVNFLHLDGFVVQGYEACRDWATRADVL